MSDAYENYASPKEDWFRGFLNRILHLLVFLAIAILLTCWFLPLLRERQKQQRELQVLKETVEQERTLLNKRTRKLNLLQSDQSYLESLARDKLDMMKPGETIFRMDPSPENNKP
ncbi:MAG: septum formation initiator family protein [Verrucomicrobia bacterium]|nr:septum formation initiator family protein [Verrucomicrobiota bacterium]